MALKTFNLNEEIYKKFSEHCRKHGISMSKRIENFIKNELERLKIGIGNIEIEKKREIKNVEHSFKKYC